MMFRTCPREKEVQELVSRGQWPQACAPELRAHVDSCRSCRELVLVATVFQRAHTETAASARLTSPGVLWWRAQLRQRNQAVERIGRPILGAQIFALAINVVLAVAFVAWQARHGFAWLTWLQQFPQAAALHLDSLWPASLWSSTLFTSAWNWMVLLPAAATLALLGGVVVYLASEKQQ